MKEDYQGNQAKSPTFAIRPTKSWRFLDLRELWQYRELAYFLTWRDIKVRYKQTVLGVAWAILQPLAMMVVFTLFFGRLAKIPSEGIPYPVFTYTALLAWQIFSRSITESSTSLVTNQRLITRVYFPRMLVPISVILAAMVDFTISSALLIVLMLSYGLLPTVNVVWFPFFTVLMMLTALGIGFWLSALNIEYRDVQYTIPFINQILLFLTPVVYPSSLVPERFQFIYSLNPMVGVIEGFRWTLLGIGSGPSPMLIISVLMALILFVSGICFFRWRERTFIDIIG